MTAKAMTDLLLDGDTSRIGNIGARFAGVVFPGETLKVSIWKDGDGFVALVTAPSREDSVVLAGVQLVPASPTTPLAKDWQTSIGSQATCLTTVMIPS